MSRLTALRDAALSHTWGAVASSAAGFVLLLAVAHTLSSGNSPHARRIESAEAASRLDLDEALFVTEDFPGWGMDGCDAVSVVDGTTGRVAHRGSTLVSPGRIAISLDPLVAFAGRSNGMFVTKSDYEAPQEDWTRVTDLYALRYSEEENRWITTYLHAPVPVQYVGGIAMAQSSMRLFVADRTDDRMCRKDTSYGISSYDVRAIDWNARQLGRPMVSMRTTLPTAYLFVTGDEQKLIAVGADEVTESGDAEAHVVMLRTDDLSPIGDPIPIPPVVTSEYRCSLGVIHAAVSPDERWLIANRWNVPEVTVVDLATRSVRSVAIDDIVGTGGVAINFQEINAGMVAIHALDKIVIMSLDGSGYLREIARANISLTDGFSAAPAGPKASIAWSGDGSHVVVSGGRSGSDEFSIWSVRNGVLERVGALEACEYREQNFPNDILTMNRINPTSTPPPTPTPSKTKTLEPIQTTTAISTPQPTSAPSSSPQPMSSPGRIHLPLALNEECRSERKPIDAVLAVDASSSMEERTESGDRKIDAAMRAAGTFVDLLRPELMDRAGVVAFNSEAHVMQALTTSPEALKAALSRVTTAPQTCIPCAIETAMQVFDGDRRPTALPVLILLTDGRSNPRPVGEAIALSKAAKDAGVTVFTVALGQDVETDALMAMASYPAAFISVADAGSLSRAFELIAQTIPCMPHQFWGGR